MKNNVKVLTEVGNVKLLDNYKQIREIVKILEDSRKTLNKLIWK